MAVLALKTEPRCKICRSAHREEIDALLERRSKLESDADGKRINLQYVLARLTELGVPNPNEENIKSHWGRQKHSFIISEAEEKEQATALDDLKSEMLATLDASDGTVDGDLRAIFKLGMHRIRGRIMRGEDPGVSVEHALKASAELTKRRDNEVKQELLGALTAGIVKSIAPASPPKQIEGAEVIEGEAVEA